MTKLPSNWRVKLARKLTVLSRMTALESLNFEFDGSHPAHRLGITGPPGAGKSTIIGLLAEHWVELGTRVGVLAIDPTSPFSGGSLLGDRVRMDHLSGADKIFIRSIPSRSSADGLCPNVLPLLNAFDDAAFDQVIVETVGVGQVSYDARDLVDTFVLILVPESGDTIQAMKAGIIETADICVVNKADRPGADKLAAELRSIAKWRSKSSGWHPPVLSVSALDGSGIAELARAIAEHQTRFNSPERKRVLERRRMSFHLKSSVQRRLDEIIETSSAEADFDQSQLYERFLAQLRSFVPD